MEPYHKAVAQKMLENHINSHQEGDLKSSLKKLNRAILRPKGRNTTRRKYNRRIEITQQRIAIISKLLGIPKSNPDIVSSDGLIPDTVHPDAVNLGADDPDGINSDAAQPDVVNPDAFNPDAANPKWTNPALGLHTLEFTASASLHSG